MTEYIFENGALYRNIPVNSNISRKELVITHDEFVMCYLKWICSGGEANDDQIYR